MENCLQAVRLFQYHRAGFAGAPSLQVKAKHATSVTQKACSKLTSSGSDSADHATAALRRSMMSFFSPLS